ncbi:hypothetical protein HRR83_005858 [Exophiala dermatitidis]|uniref:DUF7066 domain-containing protein n=2 Tax=Exophiala dermatitidis TaxID=5970 RepID=H6BUK7_EXODN|nr:uncharacterized protein HMPREF1120_03044 [Exophiala dermatitidis NIH/UT8656]KAJ4508766.1 hypothetical protein HRR73_007435 [Exophiala dermatitidis]EHY54882.1 hypothetical protein HMPREF1120_03044 [Exophiala dermatitidis NIH/UT8656]KAJ4511008.1 hypothetical protein HRR75_005704 [Exophiala dermatitidis]KAJ4513413.1 hypothetical protein HRR74_006227 [Exophiala dermatitidis]KAJ4538032.1 hypothetical protein HRR77_007073 [Exophiala dermatitidis]
MGINWRLRETVFRLLAAVYAELGEEAFKGRYGSIAQRFGPDATYDAIKSFFNKEVSRAAEQLTSGNTGQRASGRRISQRPTRGQSRPPLLYFDDEDISILTQREAEAHFSHSLRALAKRPRVIPASPTPSATRKEAHNGDTPGLPRADMVPNGCVNGRSTPYQDADAPSICNSSQPGPSSYVTTNGQVDHNTSLIDATSKKRPHSAVEDTAEDRHCKSPLFSRTDIPRAPQSFGYVTKQGQHRCALCLSQLPSQEDLDRHEYLSKEHQRNLQNPLKVSKGREKLAQVMSSASIGPHRSTPQPTRGSFFNGVVQAETARGSPVRNNHQEKAVPPQPADHLQPDQDHDTMIDTIEIYNEPLPPSQPSHQQESSSKAALAPEDTSFSGQKVDKGKGRAASVLSLSSSTNRLLSTGLESLPQPSEAAKPRELHTGPTTARTEVGSITPLNHTSGQSSNLPPKSKPIPIFSQTEIADIMRSTELVVQLLGCVQREAAAAAVAQAAQSTSPDNGSFTSNAAPEMRSRPGESANTSQAHGQENETGQSRLGIQVKAERTKDMVEDVIIIVED